MPQNKTSNEHQKMGSMDAMAIGKKQFLKKFKTGIEQV
jgi:hypothetical protein